MQVRQQKKDDRKKLSLLVLLLLVGALAVTGTIAWLTHSSKLDNCFTVGEINIIDPNGPGPDPDGPDTPDTPGEKGSLSGNLYEPSWVDKSKLEPGVEIAKDPYVGVGKDSEPCYVYVNVSSNINSGDKIYFKINEGWEAVDGTCEKSDENYVSGLFRYKNDLSGKDAEKANVWTEKPLFEKVIVSEDADQDDFKVKVVSEPKSEEVKVPTITVKSFLHQKNNSKEEEIGKEVAENAAKKLFGYTEDNK